MQSRWNSPILKSAIVMLIIFGMKQFLNIEVGSEMVNNFVDLIFIGFFGLAAANNPESKGKF